MMQHITQTPFPEGVTDNLVDVLFNSPHIAIAYLDTHFTFVRVNQAYATATAHEPPFFVGKHYFDLYPHATQQEAKFRQVVATATPYTGHATPFADAIPPEYNTDWTLHPIKDSTGVVVGMLLCFATDTKPFQTSEFAKDALRLQHRLATTLSTTSDLQESFAIVLETVLALDGIDSGGIYLANRNNGDLTLMVHQGLSELFVAHAQHIAATDPQMEIVRAGNPVYRNYATLHVDVQERAKEGLRALAVLPIVHEGNVIAVMNLASHEIDTVPQHTRVQLESIAAFVGSVIVRIIAETTLRMSQQNFQVLFDSLDDFLFVLDEHGTIVHVNTVVERRLGYTRDELHQMHVLEVHPPERRDEAGAIVAAMLAKEVDFCPIPLITRTGSYIPVETRVTMGTWNGKNALFGISRDVTERVHAEAALNESKQRFKLALESADLGLWDWNVVTGEAFFNERWARMLGYALDEIAGNVSTWERLLHPDDMRHVMDVLNAHLAGETTAYITEYRLRTSDGNWKWVQDYGKVIERDKAGSALRMIGTHRDISQQKHYEAELMHARKVAEAAAAARSNFLATMSHEIRTPMNAIIGMTYLLLDSHLTTQQLNDVQIIRNSAEGLLSLINDILDFSKIEAERIDLEQTPFNIYECIEDTLNMLASRAYDKNINLACLFHNDVPVDIVGDAVRVRQIVTNLLSNAVKFTEQGEVVVEVRAEEWASDEAHSSPFTCHISVRDTGIGIPEHYINHLFQPFTQADASMSRRYGGTGLGLTISKRLAEMMGGTVWVESILGQGSTFHATFRTTPATEQTHNYLNQQPCLHNKRVLIVTTNPTNRHILSHITTRWGMVPTVCDSYITAMVQVHRSEPYHVALLEITDNDDTFYMLFKQLRRLHHPEKIPIFVYASVKQQHTIASDIASDITAILVKPVRLIMLYHALMTHYTHDKQPSAKQPTPLWTAVDRTMGQTHPLRLLLAEDNIINQKVAVRLLERIGYSVDIATNGIEALAALQGTTYDVVFMDVQMPDLDGVETTRHIRKLLPAQQQPWIIAMTAHAMPEDRDICMAAGMNDYLSKPIYLEELAQKIIVAQQHICHTTEQKAVEQTAGEIQPVVPPTDYTHTNTTNTAACTFNPSLLNEIEPTFRRELIALFVRDTPEKLNALHQAVMSHDAHTVQFIAHTLKSGGAQLGLCSFSSICQEIETIGRTNTLTHAMDMLMQLQHELTEAERFFATY